MSSNEESMNMPATAVDHELCVTYRASKTFRTVEAPMVASDSIQRLGMLQMQVG